jgi:hypothetical protein
LEQEKTFEERVDETVIYSPSLAINLRKLLKEIYNTNGVADVPLDGVIYGRRNKRWEEISESITRTSQLVNNGEDGINPFITQADIVGDYVNNNVDIIQYVVLEDGYTHSELFNAVNEAPTFEVKGTESLWLEVLVINSGTISEARLYKFYYLGKGTYGEGGTQLQVAPSTFNVRCKLISTYGFNPEQNPTTQIVDENWDITGTTLSDFINNLEVAINLQNTNTEGLVVIKVINNSIAEEYLYNGEGGLFGLGEEQTVEDDFNQFNGGNSDSPAITFQQVTDNNNTTTNDIVVNAISVTGTPTEIPTSTKIAVFGDPDGNGLQLVGYIEKSSLGGGAVDSVNGQTGTVILDAEDVLGFIPENIANKNANNGYAPLDSGGKIPLANLPSTLLKYQGVWNASTNTPTLTNPDLTKIGNVYNVSVAGTQFGITWGLGDWLIYNASGVPEKSDNSDDVVSVNGQTGVVTLNFIEGSGTINTIPVFTPDGTTLGNSRITQFPTREVRITNPVNPSSTVSFYPESEVDAALRLRRNQSFLTFTLGNPDISQENRVFSDNYLGTSYTTKGYLAFRVGINGVLESLRLLGTGLVQVSGTGTKGILGTSLFDKQSDLNAFAQLGDISAVNTTATPLSLATLNATYADKPIGFVVDAPLLNLSYRKNATGWTSTVTVTVL